jgi:hypothetical protein
MDGSRWRGKRSNLTQRARQRCVESAENATYDEWELKWPVSGPFAVDTGLQGETAPRNRVAHKRAQAAHKRHIGGT